jgi:hypothetical protein
MPGWLPESHRVHYGTVEGADGKRLDEVCDTACMCICVCVCMCVCVCVHACACIYLYTV